MFSRRSESAREFCEMMRTLNCWSHLVGGWLSLSYRFEGTLVTPFTWSAIAFGIGYLDNDYLPVFGIRCNFGAAKNHMYRNYTDPEGHRHVRYWYPWAPWLILLVHTYGPRQEQTIKIHLVFCCLKLNIVKYRQHTLSNNDSTLFSHIQMHEFNWTQDELSVMESSFFYGYLITQVGCCYYFETRKKKESESTKRICFTGTRWISRREVPAEQVSFNVWLMALDHSFPQFKRRWFFEEKHLNGITLK